MDDALDQARDEQNRGQQQHGRARRRTEQFPEDAPTLQRADE